jgi:hypothetical protein
VPAAALLLVAAMLGGGGSVASAAPGAAVTDPAAAIRTGDGGARVLEPRDGPVTDTWYTNPLSLTILLGASPTIAETFLDRPGSYEWQGSIPDGWSTTPYVNYGSYARFADDVANGTPPDVPTLMYDPEQWDRNVPSDLRAGESPYLSQTPTEEQRHPAKYMRMFGLLAHRLGYRVIDAPGLNLVGVVGADCVRRSGERAVAAYLRCGLAGAAAVEADEIDVQFQSEECATAQYASDLGVAARQAAQANPQVRVLSGLSTAWCAPSGAQLQAAHRAVAGITAGHFFAIFPGGTVAAVDFLNLLAPVIVGTPGFAPADLVVPQGATVTWRVSWNAKQAHSITDHSGLRLFDSGLLRPGTVFRHRYPGGGRYATADVTSGLTGTISIPATASPQTGDVSTPFTIRASSAAAPTGFVYVTQIQRPGSIEWEPWRTGPVNRFVADAGVGTYAFRVRLERKGSDRFPGWSPTATIAVG